MGMNSVPPSIKVYWASQGDVRASLSASPFKGSGGQPRGPKVLKITQKGLTASQGDLGAIRLMKRDGYLYGWMPQQLEFNHPEPCGCDGGILGRLWALMGATVDPKMAFKVRRDG